MSDPSSSHRYRIERAIDAMNLGTREFTPAADSYGSSVAIVELDHGERAVVKVAHNRDKFFRELRMLERLRGVIPVPHLLDQWHGDDEMPGAFLLSYLDGEPAGNAIDERLSTEMGEMLARLHEIAMPGCGYDGERGFVITSDNDWRVFQRELFRKWSPDAAALLPAEMMARSIEHFELIIEELPEADEHRLVHMDYRPGNILVRGSRLVAVIDFESSRGGSPGVDFTKMKIYAWDRFPGSETAFREGYRSIRPLPDLDRLLPFYLFMNAFGGVAWCSVRDRTRDHFITECIDQLSTALKSKR